MRFDLRILLIFFLLSVSNISSQTLIPDPPEVNAKSYILVEAHTNEIISEQNADLPSGLASLTKIMTGYVVADQIEKGFISKNDQVLISDLDKNRIINSIKLNLDSLGIKENSNSDILINFNVDATNQIIVNNRIHWGELKKHS